MRALAVAAAAAAVAGRRAAELLVAMLPMAGLALARAIRHQAATVALEGRGVGAIRPVADPTPRRFVPGVEVRGLLLDSRSPFQKPFDGRSDKVAEHVVSVCIEVSARLFERVGEEVTVPRRDDALSPRRHVEVIANVDAEQQEFGHRSRRKRVGPPRACVEVSQTRDAVVPERVVAACAQEVLDGGARLLQEIRALT